MNVIGTLVRSLASRSREPADGSDGDSESNETGGSDTALFHCPRCDTVYVATAKEVCSDCGTAVSPVPATLGAE